MTPSPLEFTLILFTMAFAALFVMMVGVPFVADHMVSENATWIFHNEVVKDKWIIQTSDGFLNWGNTKYYVKTENRTFEVDKTTYDLVFPEKWLGYYVNNKTNEITTSWHI